jgi:hypothetical protein
LLHIFYPIFNKTSFTNPIVPIGLLGWFYNLISYTADLLGIPELIEIIFILMKWNIRPLTIDEVNLVNSVFGHTIDLSPVTIDRNCRLGMKFADAYVSFNTINYRGELEDAIFIHEMVHIWQYQQFGSIYIPHAIHAQFHGGYDYGGVENLYFCMLEGKKIIQFNFEQQAEIIEDMYRRQIYGLDDRDLLGLQVYRYYVDQLTHYP